MNLIDPHIHCVSRTTDDYLYMARAGVVAVSEPAFWAGYDRSSASSVRRLLQPPAERRAQAGRALRHRSLLRGSASTRRRRRTWTLAREVIALIPPLLAHPRVLGVGEIGLNKNTRNEITIFEEQVDLAARIRSDDPDPHATPRRQAQGDVDHLRHSQKRPAHPPERVLIDHCEEHTIRLAKQHGFWCGLTIYPVTKVTPAARRRHSGNVRHRSDLREQRQRLGREQPVDADRHAARVPPPRAFGRRGDESLPRQPVPLLRPIAEVETADRCARLERVPRSCTQVRARVAIVARSFYLCTGSVAPRRIRECVARRGLKPDQIATPAVRCRA